MNGDFGVRGNLSMAEGSRYENLIQSRQKSSLAGWYFPQALQEYDIHSQRKQMDMGPLGDPKSKEYKAMERIKNKAEKMAKKNRLKAKNESIGMNFIRKHYQKNDE